MHEKVGAMWVWLKKKQKGNAKMASSKLDFENKSEIEVVQVPRAIR